MFIAIVTNQQSRGLALDASLLKGFIEPLGHSVKVLQYDQPHDEEADLFVFLEVTVRHLVHLSKYPPWLVVNPEFLRAVDLAILRSSFSKIICKTHEAHRICRELFGDQAVYTGFLAQDRYLPEIERGPGFLHVAGHSRVKGTFSVIDAWRWSHNGIKLNTPLIVVCDFIKQEDVPEHVTVLDGIFDEELAHLQNVCKFHLQPSMTEGYGHVLRESLSVNAVLLTTDAPPMNEIESALLIHGEPSRTFNHSQFYDVSPLDIYQRVQEMLVLYAVDLPFPEVRKEFLHGNEEFKHNFSALLDEFKPKPSIPEIVPGPRPRISSEQLQIAFIGNFETPDSTETLIWDALTRGLGHDVEMIQENRATLEQLRRATMFNDMLFWVRTPNYLKIPDEQMEELLASLKKRGMPTASIHLDKFWGIPDRERLIGVHPFWKTEFVFTADGSRGDDFAARGVNHFWMRPAMSEEYLHPGRIKDEYRCDVGFVGAKGYHSEYPFRREMVEFLEQTYGERFKHITNIRGHELNSFYASCKVTVGDCIFAGTPNYWSDRVPETIGRHGLLLHPFVEGLQVPMAIYEAQNLESLRYAIETLLSEISQHPEGMKALIKDGVECVRQHDTWTVRMAEIIKMITT
jgi:hypothetical protein